MPCTSTEKDLSNTNSLNHPCFSENAHYYYSRLHLPVARTCNIQCNYCNRRYDCVNESRPGVSSRLLNPVEALELAMQVGSKSKDLSVIGIAGPGDPLSNPDATFDTFRSIRGLMPDVHFCLSTNGMDLIDHIDTLLELNINFVTVTINTMDPKIASEIYAWVKIDGKRQKGIEAMKVFLERQQAGLKLLIQNGITVKVNTVLMPGINDKEMVSLSKRLRLMGVTLQNIVPLIAKEEHGSRFGKQNRPEPSSELLENTRIACGTVKQMSHCRQCRADAMGRLSAPEHKTNLDAFREFTSKVADFGYSKRKMWQEMVNPIIGRNRSTEDTCEVGMDAIKKALKIAVCTTGSGFADLEISEAKEFYIFLLNKGEVQLVNIRKLSDDYFLSPMEKILEAIGDCQAVLSNRFGYKVFKKLEAEGVYPVSDLSTIPVNKAVALASSKISCHNEKEFASTVAVNSDC